MDAATLAILVIVGGALRFYKIDTSLWFDEIVTLLDSVRSPLSRIVTHFPSNNDHPLYSVLAHLSVDAFGEAPWVLRLPSALFGVAAIPLLYLVGLAVTDRREALASSVILTVSYHHVWFSQNARGYTALLFCVLLSTYMLIRWLDTGRRSFLIAYAIVTAVGAYAHLTMVLVSISHALAFGISWLSDVRESRIRSEWRTLVAGFIGAALLTVALYAPMVADVGSFFSTQTATATEVATPGWAIVAALRGLQVGFGAMWGVAIGTVVFAAGAWSYWRDRRAVALLILLPVPVTVLLALALNRPIFPRFVFFAMGFAAAGGDERRGRHRARGRELQRWQDRRRNRCGDDGDAVHNWGSRTVDSISSLQLSFSEAGLRTGGCIHRTDEGRGGCADCRWRTRRHAGAEVPGPAVAASLRRLRVSPPS